MEIFLHAFISYFVIIDPIGVSLIFSSLTNDKGKQYRRSMALKSVGITFVLILLFGFIGEPFLTQLGISIDAFRIAGGLLLFYTAFNMVIKKDVFSITEEENVDISVYPLTIPLMSGPGCLTLTVLLFSNAKTDPNGILQMVCAVVLICTVSLLSFFTAERVLSVIGNVGNDIIKRLLGVVLAALSIQFIADGVRGFIQ